jgi:hypothetical protein
MNLKIAVLLVALLLAPNVFWGQNAETIEFGQGHYFLVQITDGIVVGGVARDQHFRWRCMGGAFDGKNLTATFATDQDNSCNGTKTYNFEVQTGHVLLRSSMNKCGAVEDGKFTRFPRVQ